MVSRTVGSEHSPPSTGSTTPPGTTPPVVTPPAPRGDAMKTAGIVAGIVIGALILALTGFIAANSIRIPAAVQPSETTQRVDTTIRHITEAPARPCDPVKDFTGTKPRNWDQISGMYQWTFYGDPTRVTVPKGWFVSILDHEIHAGGTITLRQGDIVSCFIDP